MSDAHPPAHLDTTADHHDDHGSGHEHEGERLGPIDVVVWGAGLLGVLLGGVTALAFVVSTGRF